MRVAMSDAGAHDHDGGGRGHILVVAYGLQGHLNPTRALARRLARVYGAAARVTLSVTISGHRRMFLSLASPDEEVSDGLISYVPYSDGFEFGATPRDAEQLARSTHESGRSLSAIVRRFAATGRPVTCIVSAFSLPAADVAAEHGIPLAVYWIQAATALAVYYHYFHGYEQLVASHVADRTHKVSIPGLRPLPIHDFPSFLVDTSGREQGSVRWFRSLFEHIDREKPKILVNTLDVLEATALKELKHELDVLAVGPMLPHLQQSDETEDRIHLYKHDQKGYMEWLEAKPARSVVYMSYGSMLSYNSQQVQEILQGLRECGRPYLWMVRKEGRDEEVERCLMEDNGSSSEQGMILEWCDQLEVLSHSSVGCFITHCGWNSTLEAITLGVPMVTVPNWSDQLLNSHLVEELGIGVRAGCNDAGLLVGTELAKCIEIVLGDSDKAMDMYERAKALKDKIRKEVIEGGLVELGLQEFISTMHI